MLVAHIFFKGKRDCCTAVKIISTPSHTHTFNEEGDYGYVLLDRLALVSGPFGLLLWHDEF